MNSLANTTVNTIIGPSAGKDEFTPLPLSMAGLISARVSPHAGWMESGYPEGLAYDQYERVNYAADTTAQDIIAGRFTDQPDPYVIVAEDTTAVHRSIVEGLEAVASPEYDESLTYTIGDEYGVVEQRRSKRLPAVSVTDPEGHLYAPAVTTVTYRAYENGEPLMLERKVLTYVAEPEA